ncbi:MAG TPA: dolichyl-phosphate beta-glucosyltransferase [Candidatus Paceibacterota bacterium]
MKLSIVIPAYNEESRIGKTLQRVIGYLENYNPDYEILAVNDGSSDKTETAVKKYQNGKIKILENKTNRGKGYSVRQGILAASGAWILFTDADLSTPIEELDNFLRSGKDFDVIIGSRGIKGSKILARQPLYRELGGKLVNFFVRLAILPGIKDTQCGFKLFRREAALQIFKRQKLDRWSFDVEIIYIARKKKLKILELPVRWENNPETKVAALRAGLRMLFDIIKIRINDLKGLYE